MYKIILFNVFYTLFWLTNVSVQAKTIKLTTWNVEWLVSSKDIINTPIPKDIAIRKTPDFKNLLFYSHKLQADIIAAQEVGSIETLTMIFPTDQYFFFISKDLIAQRTAIVIRKNLFEHIKQNMDLTELSLIHKFRPLRSGLDITIYTKENSLRILVVHLKSGCQDYPLDRAKLKQSCLLLKAQLPILKKWVTKRIEEQQAFIVLGDFNRVISPNDSFFTSLSSKNLFFPTAYKANPCWEGNFFIDGFIIDPKANQWLIQNSLRVMKYTEQGYDAQNKLSDHCPVSVKLSIP